MGTATKAKKNGSKGAETESIIDPAAQLHEIQKLLFGQQINHLEKVISELKEDIVSQLSQLEKKFTQNLDKQRKDLSTQLNELAKHLDHVDGEHQNREALIEDDIDALRKNLMNFEAQTESAHDELEKQLQTESQKLSEELNAKHDDALKKLKASSNNLDDQKVDRASLAELFSNVAQSIQAQA